MTGVTVYVILKVVIKTFRNRDAARLYASRISRRFQKCARQAFQKLRMLDAAWTLGGDRRGQYSIRVGDRYRICFAWRDGDAHDVEITDYH